MMYFTQEQYDRLTLAMLDRSNDKSRTVIYLSFEECERYCEHYLSNKMKELKKVTNAVIGRLENDKTNFDDREIYELKDLSYEVFVLTLGTYNPKANCSFKTFFYGNLLRKFYTYGRDKTRKSRCNWEQVWDDEHHCYKRDENGNIVKKPVFDISMYSVEKKDGNEKEIWQYFKAKDNVENTVIEKQMPIEEYSDSVKAFLENMSRDAKIIATYILDGYTKEMIIECKGITTEQYNNAIREFGTFENVHILLGGQCNAKN
nr:MAG TPA: putative RNA polymerase [Caudoviricetes sp.]